MQITIFERRSRLPDSLATQGLARPLVGYDVVQRPFVVPYTAVKRIVVASFMLLGTIQLIDYINFAVDDVFLTLRVAMNAAAGQGMVFNPAEAVEGTSSFLWTSLLTLVALMPAMEAGFTMLWVSKALSLVAGGATIFVVYTTIRSRTGSSTDALAGAGMLATSGSFVLWSVGGMETTLYACEIALAVYGLTTISHSKTGLQKGLTALSIALIAATLTRPEATMHSFVVWGVLLLSVPGPQRTTMLRAIAAYAVAALAFYLWRFLTYGDLVPNTFYAKTAGGLKSYVLGGKYLLAGLAYILGPFTLALLLRKGQSDRLFTRCTLALVLSVSAFIVYSSGDWMAGYRFLVPMMPLAIVLVMDGIHQLRQRLQIDRSVLLVCVLLISVGQALHTRMLVRGQIQTMPSGFGYHIGHSVPWQEEIGRYLKQHARPDFSVMLGEVGMIGYLNPQATVVDLYGLLDRTIARSKKDGLLLSPEYAFDKKPDYALFYNGSAAAQTVAHTHASSDYIGRVAQHPRFAREYRPLKEFTSMTLYERIR